MEREHLHVMPRQHQKRSEELQAAGTELHRELHRELQVKPLLSPTWDLVWKSKKIFTAAQAKLNMCSVKQELEGEVQKWVCSGWINLQEYRNTA